jgi:hypothetical protein
MITALPTGTCFDDVLFILLEFKKYQPKKLKNLKIVHALCMAPGTLSAHAWVEVEDGCIFNAIIDNEKVTLMASPAKDYYETIQLVKYKKYTPERFFRNFVKTNHPGPWNKQYRSYCNDTQKNREWESKEQTPFPKGHRGGVK